MRGSSKNIMYNKVPKRKTTSEQAPLFASLQEPASPCGKEELYAKENSSTWHIAWKSSRYSIRIRKSSLDKNVPSPYPEDYTNSRRHHDRILSEVDVLSKGGIKRWDDVPRVFQEKFLELLEVFQETDAKRPGYAIYYKGWPLDI